MLDVFLPAFLAGGEGWKTHDELVGKDAKGPPVHRVPVALLVKHLWRHVVPVSDQRDATLSRVDPLAQTIIGQSNIAFVIKKDVLGLEVSIENTEPMQVANS